MLARKQRGHKIGERAHDADGGVVRASFLLDPPLLAASGAAIERLGADGETASRMGRGTLTLFIGVSISLYANLPGLRRIWGPFGARSGREFMLISGLASVDEESISPPASPRRAVAVGSVSAMATSRPQAGEAERLIQSPTRS